MPACLRLLPVSWFLLSALFAIGLPAGETSEGLKSGAPLAGQWQRPDGGYIIEVRRVDPNGTLDAAYFNPRSIRVAAARWRFGAGRLQVRIDLNDRGYEGALYLLHYDPESDQLTGTYRPANGETFAVEFERMTP